jgi:hypothetical protein
VTRFLKRENRIEGVGATNVLTGERLEVRSKMVLNTAGPWASKLLETGMGLHLEQKPVFSRDVCFVVSRPPSGKYALACQIKTEDADAIFSRGGRHLFVAPWRDCTLVGVWHGVFDGAPEEVTVTREEMKKFLDEANKAYPDLLLSIEDIAVVNTGLILFAENRKGSPTSASEALHPDRPRQETQGQGIDHPDRRPRDDRPGDGREGGGSHLQENGKEAPRLENGNDADLRGTNRSFRRLSGTSPEAAAPRIGKWGA